MLTIEECGQKALEHMLMFFHEDVTNPANWDHSDKANHSREVINTILLACRWTWPEVYPYHQTVEYCCLTAGAAWEQVGLNPCWLATFFASTMRLDAWANYEPWNEHQNPKPAGIPTEEWRKVANYNAHSTKLVFDPLPGDIVLIGDGDPAAGDHCTVLESFDPSTMTFHHVSGNGRGYGPDGKIRTGIVRGSSKLGGPGYCVRRVIRPSIHDILQ
jgi:hypothetical protein